MHAIASIIFGFVMILVVTILAAVTFTVWVLYMAIRAMVWAVGRLAGAAHRSFAGPRRFPMLQGWHHFLRGFILRRMLGQLRPCPHLRCGQLNPRSARFCRRCGRALTDDRRAMAKSRTAAA